MTMKWTATLAALAMLVAIGAPTTARATLLSNASFESVLEFDDTNANGPNWFAFFGAGSTGTFSTVNPAPPIAGITPDPTDGANHLVITNDGTPDGFSGVFQRTQTSIGAGVDLDFSFDARSSGSATFPLGVDVRFEFVGSDGNVFSATPNTQIGGLLTDQYDEFSISTTTPIGTEEVQVVIAVETFSANGTAGELFVDNASLTAVPEPTAVALLGLGGLVCGARARRSRA